MAVYHVPVPELGGDDRKERKMGKIPALMKMAVIQRTQIDLKVSLSQVDKGYNFKLTHLMNLLISGGHSLRLHGAYC